MPDTGRARCPGLLPRLLLASCLVVTAAAPAVTFEPLEFVSDEQRELYLELVAELRCLVCQNQNLAESDADLAGDLRAEVYRLVGEDASRDDIVDFMVERYGDFVLYRPPLRASTVLLWLGPFVLAAGALFALLSHLRRRGRAAAGERPLSESERAQIERLVEDDRAQPR